MKKSKQMLIGVLTVAVAAGSFMAFRHQTTTPLKTVPYVDLQKYVGKWYEISAFPQRFQKGCHCSMAEYSLHPDGYVLVRNSCRKNSPEGKLDVALGKAWVTDKKTNSKLKVQFFWPFKGDYWIIDLASDYSYAVVVAPNRKYLWILARQPKMDQQLYQQIVGRVKDKGFDISKIQLSDQSCR